MHVRRVLAAAAVLAAAFGGLTALALEGRDVAVLHTTDGAGALRATRVWVAEHDGALWVEAATPERGFYQDLLVNPAAEVEHLGRTTRMQAVPLPGPDGHARIRELLRAKYGWADRWVGLLQDTSRSVAVRLTPLPGGIGGSP